MPTKSKQPQTNGRRSRSLCLATGSPPIPKVSACCKQPMREGEYCPECNEHTELIPDPEAVWTLGEIRPGLFLFNGTLGLKTEYDGDIFVCESGEAFWGGTRTPEHRASLVVTPVGRDSCGCTNGVIRGVGRDNEEVITDCTPKEDIKQLLDVIELDGD